MARLFLTASLLAQASAAASVPLPIEAAFGPAVRQGRCSKNVCQRPSPRSLPILSRRRAETRLHLSYDTASDLSTMPLSQLLELLHQRNIRYAPSASREELEDLLLNHFADIKERQKPANEYHDDEISDRNKRIEKSKSVVDAEVLPDQPRSDRGIDERRRRADGPRNKRRRKTSQRVYGANDRTVSRYQTKRREKRQKQYSEDNIIDAVFDLPDSYDGSETYQNGLQIFLMGFAEAGKTAAELALDAAKNTISAPFDDNKRYRGDYYRRKVTNVDGIDYRRQKEYYEKPRRPRRRRPQRYGEYNGETERYTERGESELAYTTSASSALGEIQTQTSSPMDIGSIQTQKSAKFRSRNSTHENDSSKPIYGLGYALDSTKESGRFSHHHKQKWKDRVRKKFDAALGLHPTAAPTEKESYYDSWKRNMREMGDSHKARLRRKMNDAESPEVQFDVQSTSTAFARIPQNRRARMRAAKNGITNEPPSLHQSQTISISKASRNSKLNSKIRPDEEPFWKEKGTIASLLFNNNSSSLTKSVRMKNKRSLEVRPFKSQNFADCIALKFTDTIYETNNLPSYKQLLLSPAGRERTITSLLIYFTRTLLSVFGNLCRWAGVRGAIPQPVVVITVCAVILSSYRQQKVFMMGLTLLAIRMLGEFIHGSVHGNEFWDDEYDTEMHEWIAD